MGHAIRTRENPREPKGSSGERQKSGPRQRRWRGAVSAAAAAARPLRRRSHCLNADTFAPLDQVIGPQPDGILFRAEDAQPQLSRGIPRFYLMRMKNRTWQFDAVKHHANTTQCLGPLYGLPWFIRVAGSTIIGATERVDPDKGSQILKADGYDHLPAAVEDFRLFRVDGSRFLKLPVGTWHAAPLFQEPYMEFYNLELSNTNAIDHPNYYFKKSKGSAFEVDNPCSADLHSDAISNRDFVRR